MKLKLQLVQDGEVVFEIPLSPTDWPKEQLENELEALENNFQRFSKIFATLSHDTRLKMMKRLMEEEDCTMNFTDFMRDLNLNPKIVWENAKKLREGGLLPWNVVNMMRSRLAFLSKYWHGFMDTNSFHLKYKTKYNILTMKK